MNTIIPAIIPESRYHLEHQLEQVKDFTQAVQIDLVDGMFAPVASWPYRDGKIEELADASFLKDFSVEVDLMVAHPEDVLSHCVGFGAERIVVHLESTEKISEIIAHRNRHTYKLGLSISNNTPLEKLYEHIKSLDYIQLMGISEIGTQGQPFDGRVLGRIADIKKLYPDIEISIDGSVNRETLPVLKVAGATRFVSGSAILGASNSHLAFKELSELI